MLPRLIVRQQESSSEIRSVVQHAILNDIPFIILGIEQLQNFSFSVNLNDVLPIGSVEFIREFMRVTSIPEPENISYPIEISHLLHRSVKMQQVGSILGRHFVKPVETKIFTGFIYDCMQNPRELEPHDKEQFDVLMGLPAETKVWVSEPVKFVSEWRYYIIDGRIIGKARYDPDGADDAPEPDAIILEIAIRSLTTIGGKPIGAYALDMGVLDSGETALVECNDAWAIGLYGKALDSRNYFEFLQARWSQIVKSTSVNINREPFNPCRPRHT